MTMTGNELRDTAAGQLDLARAQLEYARGLSAYVDSPWWSTFVPAYTLLTLSASAKNSIALGAAQRTLCDELKGIIATLEDQVAAGAAAGDAAVDDQTIAYLVGQLGKCTRDVAAIAALLQRRQDAVDQAAGQVVGLPADVADGVANVAESVKRRLKWWTKWGPLLVAGVVVVVLVVGGVLVWRRRRVVVAAVAGGGA